MPNLRILFEAMIAPNLQYRLSEVRRISSRNLELRICPYEWSQFYSFVILVTKQVLFLIL